MNPPPDLLLVAEKPVAQELSAYWPAGRAMACSDPYEALLEMERRPWPVVIVSAPPGDFAGLCRASRRLQKKARIVALCSPRGEPQAMELGPAVLDDHLIYPPTRAELTALLPRRAIEDAAPATGLSARDYTQLISATRGVGELEAAVAGLAGDRLGRPVRWAALDSLPPGGEPPLLSAEDPPRALVAQGPAGPIGPDAQAAIAELRQCLPALLEAARRTDSLHRLAIRDHLTGAYNLRYFVHLTNQILLRTGQKHFRATLLLYDIDNFKRYNDEFGHAAGDEILKETAALMKRIGRSQDVVARIGGDEFAVLFWDSEPPRTPDSRPLESAHDLADRFRRAVSDLEFHFLGPQARGVLSISGGLAVFPRDGQSCDQLLEQAGQALIAAKRAGKNSIRIVGPT